MSPSQTATPRKTTRDLDVFRFADLPIELRFRVYDSLFVNNHLHVIDGEIHSNNDALLHTCRQLRREAMPWFCKDLTFTVTNLRLLAWYPSGDEDNIRILQPRSPYLNHITELVLTLPTDYSLSTLQLPSLRKVAVHLPMCDALIDHEEPDLETAICRAATHQLASFHQEVLRLLRDAEDDVQISVVLGSVTLARDRQFGTACAFLDAGLVVDFKTEKVVNRERLRVKVYTEADDRVEELDPADDWTDVDVDFMT